MKCEDYFSKNLSRYHLSSPLVREHGLAPLYFGLFEDAQYRNDWLECQHRNFRYLQLAETLENHFDSLNIRFSWLKGMHLIKRVYPQNIARPMSDLDLLVSLEDLKVIHDILTGLGCRAPEFIDQMSGHKREYLYPINGELICVELHTSLYAYHDVPTSEQLSNEEHFVFLLYHYIWQHSGARLIWLFDILLVCEKQDLNWEVFRTGLLKLNLKDAYNLLYLNCKDSQLLPNLFDVKRHFFVNLFLCRTKNWRYYVVKHIGKGVGHSLRYDFTWLVQKILRRKVVQNISS